jgi:hypothetical protein
VTRRVRVGRDETPEQVYARLPRYCQDALGRVTAALRDTQRAEAVWLAQEASLHALVHDALDAGVPAWLLGNRLGVTQSRVYQIVAKVDRARSGEQAG